MRRLTLRRHPKRPMLYLAVALAAAAAVLAGVAGTLTIAGGL